MDNGRAMITRSCFVALLVVGLGFLLIGMAVEPFMPVFALDRVLTPEELADPEKRQATQALLERAQGNRWLIWSLAGIIVAVLSGVGLWTIWGEGRRSHNA